MKTLLEKYLRPVSAPEGGGGGGDGGASGAANSGAAPGAGGAGGQGGGAAPGGTSTGGEPPAPYRPEGLADEWSGASDKETIDKLFGVAKGYRDRDGARGVPEKPDAYHTFDVDKLVADKAIDPSMKPHIEALAKDPIMGAVSAYAFEHKVPVPVMQGIIAKAFSEAQKAGIMEPMLDEKAERAALVPDAAKGKPQAEQDQAVDARLKANEDWVKLMMAPGADGKASLPKEVGENALLMLMDTAQGNQFLEWVRAKVEGGGTGPSAAGQGGAQSGDASREQLRADMKALDAKRGTPDWTPQKHEALMERYRKAFPD